METVGWLGDGGLVWRLWAGVEIEGDGGLAQRWRAEGWCGDRDRGWRAGVVWRRRAGVETVGWCGDGGLMWRRWAGVETVGWCGDGGLT